MTRLEEDVFASPLAIALQRQDFAYVQVGSAPRKRSLDIAASPRLHEDLLFVKKDDEQRVVQDGGKEDTNRVYHDETGGRRPHERVAVLSRDISRCQDLLLTVGRRTLSPLGFTVQHATATSVQRRHDEEGLLGGRPDSSADEGSYVYLEVLSLEKGLWGWDNLAVGDLIVSVEAGVLGGGGVVVPAEVKSVFDWDLLMVERPLTLFVLRFPGCLPPGMMEREMSMLRPAAGRPHPLRGIASSAVSRQHAFLNNRTLTELATGGGGEAAATLPDAAARDLLLRQINGASRNLVKTRAIEWGRSGLSSSADGVLEDAGDSKLPPRSAKAKANEEEELVLGGEEDLHLHEDAVIDAEGSRRMLQTLARDARRYKRGGFQLALRRELSAAGRQLASAAARGTVAGMEPNYSENPADTDRLFRRMFRDQEVFSTTSQDGAEKRDSDASSSMLFHPEYWRRAIRDDEALLTRPQVLHQHSGPRPRDGINYNGHAQDVGDGVAKIGGDPDSSFGSFLSRVKAQRQDGLRERLRLAEERMGNRFGADHMKGSRPRGSLHSFRQFLQEQREWLRSGPLLSDEDPTRHEGGETTEEVEGPRASSSRSRKLQRLDLVASLDELERRLVERGVASPGRGSAPREGAHLGLGEGPAAGPLQLRGAGGNHNTTSTSSEMNDQKVSTSTASEIAEKTASAVTAALERQARKQRLDRLESALAELQGEVEDQHKRAAEEREARTRIYEAERESMEKARLDVAVKLEKRKRALKVQIDSTLAEMRDNFSSTGAGAAYLLTTTAGGSTSSGGRRGDADAVRNEVRARAAFSAGIIRGEGEMMKTKQEEVSGATYAGDRESLEDADVADEAPARDEDEEEEDANYDGNLPEQEASEFSVSDEDFDLDFASVTQTSKQLGGSPEQGSSPPPPERGAQATIEDSEFEGGISSRDERVPDELAMELGNATFGATTERTSRHETYSSAARGRAGGGPVERLYVESRYEFGDESSEEVDAYEAEAEKVAESKARQARLQEQDAAEKRILEMVEDALGEDADVDEYGYDMLQKSSKSLVAALSPTVDDAGEEDEGYGVFGDEVDDHSHDDAGDVDNKNAFLQPTSARRIEQYGDTHTSTPDDDRNDTDSSGFPEDAASGEEKAPRIQRTTAGRRGRGAGRGVAPPRSRAEQIDALPSHSSSSGQDDENYEEQGGEDQYAYGYVGEDEEEEPLEAEMDETEQDAGRAGGYDDGYVLENEEEEDGVEEDGQDEDGAVAETNVDLLLEQRQPPFAYYTENYSLVDRILNKNEREQSCAESRSGAIAEKRKMKLELEPQEKDDASATGALRSSKPQKNSTALSPRSAESSGEEDDAPAFARPAPRLTMGRVVSFAPPESAAETPESVLLLNRKTRENSSPVRRMEETFTALREQIVDTIDDFASGVSAFMH